jgi:hypothetical protein
MAMRAASSCLIALPLNRMETYHRGVVRTFRSSAGKQRLSSRYEFSQSFAQRFQHGMSFVDSPLLADGCHAGSKVAVHAATTATEPKRAFRHAFRKEKNLSLISMFPRQ